jgi:hypothetical protein
MEEYNSTAKVVIKVPLHRKILRSEQLSEDEKSWQERSRLPFSDA